MEEKRREDYNPTKRRKKTILTHLKRNQKESDNRFSIDIEASKEEKSKRYSVSSNGLRIRYLPSIISIDKRWRGIDILSW